jgi:hypothetical protein
LYRRRLAGCEAEWERANANSGNSITLSFETTHAEVAA